MNPAAGIHLPLLVNTLGHVAGPPHSAFSSTCCGETVVERLSRISGFLRVLLALRSYGMWGRWPSWPVQNRLAGISN